MLAGDRVARIARNSFSEYFDACFIRMFAGMPISSRACFHAKPLSARPRFYFRLADITAAAPGADGLFHAAGPPFTSTVLPGPNALFRRSRTSDRRKCAACSCRSSPWCSHSGGSARRNKAFRTGQHRRGEKEVRQRGISRRRRIEGIHPFARAVVVGIGQVEAEIAVKVVRRLEGQVRKGRKAAVARTRSVPASS